MKELILSENEEKHLKTLQDAFIKVTYKKTSFKKTNQ